MKTSSSESEAEASKLSFRGADLELVWLEIGVLVRYWLSVSSLLLFILLPEPRLPYICSILDIKRKTSPMLRILTRFCVNRKKRRQKVSRPSGLPVLSTIDRSFSRKKSCCDVTILLHREGRPSDDLDWFTTFSAPIKHSYVS